MTDQLLALFSQYGIAAYFLILAVSCAGVPIPVSLMLIAAGSFVAQGDLRLWEVIVFGIAGVVIGDQVGYFVGRWGGRKLVDRLVQRFGGRAAMGRAEAYNRRWGGSAVFFSRWLVTPVAPWVNLSCGVSEYSWTKFVAWDFLGNVLWIALYVNLGRLFSDSVQLVAEVLRNMTWVLVGLLASSILGWRLLFYLRRARLRGST